MDFNNILSEEEFQDILENLKKFKNYCDEPNKLSSSQDGNLCPTPKTISELSGSSLISRLADGKRECNLRKFHSFESLNELTGHLKKSTPRNPTSANNSIRPALRTKRTSGSTMRRGTEETCICSSFCSVSEDTDLGGGQEAVSPGRGARAERVLKRQYGRQSSSDTLIEVDSSGTHSIRIKSPGSGSKRVSNLESIYLSKLFLHSRMFIHVYVMVNK